MKKISYLDFLIKIIFPLIILIGFGWMYQKEIFLFEDLGYDIFFQDNSGNIFDTIDTTKNQEVHYTIILPKKFGDFINLDTTQLEKKLNIQSIHINGEKIEKDSKIPGEENTQITIIGEAIVGGKLDNDQKLVEIIPLPFEEEKEETSLPDEMELEIEIGIEKKSYVSDFNNIIEITGGGKNLIDYLIIGEKSFQVQHKEGKSFILIEKNTFKNGTFFILAQTKNGSILPLSDPIIFSFSEENINIQAITPNQIKNTSQQTIVIQGRGFSKILSLQLSNNIILKNTHFEIISDKILIVSIPEGITPGAYHFNILSPEKIHQIKNHSLAITQ